MPEYPHHVTHRGNRRGDIFVAPRDRHVYRRLLREYARDCGLEIWAYGRMTNPVPFVVVPEREDSLATASGRARRRGKPGREAKQKRNT